MKSNLPRTKGLKREIETGNWKLEARETGNSKLETRAANFDFRFSSFQFRLSIFDLRIRAHADHDDLPFALRVTGSASRKRASRPKDYLAEYIERVKAVKAPTPSTGSFWTPQSPYSDLASDYKARNINDLIVIQVVESTTAAEDGAVKSARTFSASSGSAD